MSKTPRSRRKRIDNEIYSTQADTWWQPESAFFQMKTAFNPVRIGYAKRKLLGDFKIDPRGKTALDIGCGGGYLTEEIAGMGFAPVGIDPSRPSLDAAVEHARRSGLDIAYAVGTGEAVPFPNEAFDAVFCCDVLEHVRDLPKVISEVARVLKPGGVFTFDTFNRNWASKFVAIKVCQEWRRWAFMPPDLHVWEMFIKPRELRTLLERNRLEWQEIRGIGPDVPIPKALRLLRRRARGEMTYRDLAERIRLVESRITAVMYMGCAVKIS
jgi:2-polyprenyl-6-hydroxyphenyl methylase/3-demethylubiquinone-9 3-methyltransferase